MTNVGSLPTWPKVLLPCFTHVQLVFCLTDSWCNRYKKGREGGTSNMQIVICIESCSLPNWKFHSSPAFPPPHVSQLCDFSCKQSAGIYDAMFFLPFGLPSIKGDTLPVGLITSRCSEKEPALLQTWESGGNRDYVFFRHGRIPVWRARAIPWALAHGQSCAHTPDPVLNKVRRAEHSLDLAAGYKSATHMFFKTTSREPARKLICSYLNLLEHI